MEHPRTRGVIVFRSLHFVAILALFELAFAGFANALEQETRRFSIAGNTELAEIRIEPLTSVGRKGNKFVGNAVLILDDESEIDLFVKQKYNAKKQTSAYTLKSLKGTPNKVKAKIQIFEPDTLLKAKLLYKPLGGLKLKLNGPAIFGIVRADPPPSDPPPSDPPPSDPPPTDPPPTDPPGLDYIPLTTNFVEDVAEGAEFEYQCTGSLSFNQIFAGSITGSMEVVVEGAGPTSPVNGVEAEAIAVTQRFQLDGEVTTATFRDYGYTDDSGLTWSLGGQESDGSDWWWGDQLDYSSTNIGVGLVTGQVLISLPTIKVGTEPALNYESMTAVADDASTPLFIQTSLREVLGVEIIETPIGKFEVYKVEHTTEQIDYNTGYGAIVLSTSWERPDIGSLVSESAAAVEDELGISVLQLRSLLASFTP